MKARVAGEVCLLRNLSLLLVVGLSLVGCASADLNKEIVGNWKYDIPHMKMPGVSPAYATSKEFADLWEGSHLTVRADGTYDRSDATRTFSGKWTLTGGSLNLVETPVDGTKPTFAIDPGGSKIHGTMKQSGQTGTFEMIKG